MGLLLFAALTCAAVPVATRQVVSDPWDVGAKTPERPCQAIRSELVFMAPPATRPMAVAMLADASVRQLTDRQAADLLRQESARTLFADLLIKQITTLQARRHDALVGHVGNWSDADTVTLNELSQLTGTHYPPYRPYLVRAFADTQTPFSYFNINLCGDTLLVDDLSGGDKATRSPMIVFLQSPPVTASPSWYHSKPSIKPEW